MEHQGERLVDILAHGGVDIILAGHTHTYERFTLTHEDGHQMKLVNLSGRPRNSFLWFGAGSRRAKDLSEKDPDWLEQKGWDLGPWTVQQDDVLGDPEWNQFGLFTVGPRGSLDMELWLVDEDDDPLVREPVSLIKP